MNALTPEETQELQQDLQALIEQLRTLLQSSEEGSQPVDLGQPIGRLSRMDAVQQQHMTQANRGAAEQRLKQAEAALSRLADQNYGLCLDCGEDIGFVRLKVRPEALLCITCQGQRERRR